MDPAPGNLAARRRLLAARLREGPPLLLDGATGTELERRGCWTGLPLWSTHPLLEHPELVADVHRSYAEAGAEILTANTFRTQPYVLAREGLGERAAELTQQAIALARSAATSPLWIAGSASPLEDCYRPDLVPDDITLAREHRAHVQNLSAAGVDFILAETQHTLREAIAVLRAAQEAGVPTIASFICDANAQLLSGESLAAALAAVRAFQPWAVCVNCLPPSAARACLPALAQCGLPFGVYANLGAPTDEGGFARSEDLSPQQFAECAGEWLRAGARFIGGCCGTGPQHIHALSALLQSNAQVS